MAPGVDNRPAERIQRAERYARARHTETNCRYGNQPYDVHLEMVDAEARKYEHLLSSDEDRTVARCAAWLHDTLEDCRVTYGDMRLHFGPVVADVVYNVTNELGKNRKERAERTYPKIASCPLSTYVKLCDRFANSKASKASGDSMWEKYKGEYPAFRGALRKPGALDEMWRDLDALHGYCAD